jgi:RHS repeat-associated protein
MRFDNTTIVRIEGKLKETNDYYPYGLLCGSATISTTSSSGNYKFQNKEFNKKEFAGSWGLDWYNHGARMYDPELGRWHVQDPALQFANPYLAMSNNPVSFVDPDGRRTSVRAGETASCGYSESISNIEDYLADAFDGNARSSGGGRAQFNPYSTGASDVNSNFGNDASGEQFQVAQQVAAQLQANMRTGDGGGSKNGHWETTQVIAGSYGKLVTEGEAKGAWTGELYVKDLQVWVEGEAPFISGPYDDSWNNFLAYGNTLNSEFDGANGGNGLPPTSVRVFISLFPPTSFIDGGKQLTTGKDIYNRKVNKVDQYIFAPFGILSPFAPSSITKTLGFQIFNDFDAGKSVVDEFE